MSMLNQASWKPTPVSLSVLYRMEHMTHMVFLIPVTFAWTCSLCFISLHVLLPTFGKLKGCSHSVISLGLVCGVTCCDLGRVLAGEVKKKKKIEENKAAFQFFLNKGGVSRQKWCNFHSCGQLQLSVMHFVGSSMGASSQAFSYRIWKCHPKVPLSFTWP